MCLCSFPPSPSPPPPPPPSPPPLPFRVCSSASTEDFFYVNWHIFIAGSCRRRTTSRYCCAFPFIYKGRRYNSCTRTRHNRPWCALTPNYDRDKKWGNCASTSGLINEKHRNTVFIRWKISPRPGIIHVLLFFFEWLMNKLDGIKR